MLGFPGVELVQAEYVLTFNDSNGRQGDRCDDCAFPATDRAIAAARVDYAVGHIDFKLDGTAVAAEFVFWLYPAIADCFDHWAISPESLITTNYPWRTSNCHLVWYFDEKI